MDAPRTTSGRTRRGHRIRALPRRLVAGMLIGIGTIVGAKGERDQHWSIPPTVVSDGADQQASADGEDPDHHDQDERAIESEAGTLPACA